MFIVEKRLTAEGSADNYHQWSKKSNWLLRFNSPSALSYVPGRKDIFDVLRDFDAII